jgi:glycosyltransferase involved in cell wall biosynthesis
MSALRSLMLVSAPADASFRTQVREGRRPRPEYLRLEQEGVELLDWSQLKPMPKGRTWIGSVRHARAALRRLADFDVAFSDGEQVGVPLALAILACRIGTPHLVLGHRLTTRHKRLFFTSLKCHRAMTRIVVHSRHQLSAIPGLLGIPAAKLALLPYYADGDFWRPGHRSDEERLVVSAGREQRDYETLVRACAEPEIAVHIADGSVHSPHANHREPGRWPSNVLAGFADYTQLRDLYARAAVVAIPLIENDFQAGVTTVLEAMAMGKPIVVSATSGQSDVIEDGVTGVTVPPGDPARLGEAIRFLLDSPSERRRLGRNARDAFEAQFTLDRYASALLNLMHEIASVPSESVHPRRVTA